MFQHVAEEDNHPAARSTHYARQDNATKHLDQNTTKPDAKNQTSKDAAKRTSKTSQAAAGTTYVRWGSSTCSGSSQVVYHGVAGGSRYNQHGASNFLCMTLSPKFRLVTGNASYVYGAEYERGPRTNQDAVCAVCLSPKSSVLMIPGTNVCTPEWNAEYSGFIMAGGAHDKGSSEYICVDSK